jgi:RNA polymerase sigma factor (sigma-70 family)
VVPFPNSLLLRTQSDERLVALVQAGSERAFEAIVERYRRQLVRVARQVLEDSRAEDAVQQALVAAWTALSRGDEVRELRPWLQRAARNAALNQRRVSGYDHDELPELLTNPGPGPHDQLERRLGVRRTLAGVAALPERQREALLDIAVHGRSQDDVARDLGLSEGAVRQLVHRARVRLRATATALTPMPLAGWAAAAAGSGAGGAVVTAAKIGAVAVLAGGAAAGPVLVIEHRAQRPERRAAPHATARAAPTAAAAAPAAPAATPPRDTAARMLTAADAPGRTKAPTQRRAAGAGDVHRTNGAPGAPVADDDEHDSGDDHRRSGDDDRRRSGGDDRGDRSSDDDPDDDSHRSGDTTRTRPAEADDDAGESPESPEMNEPDDDDTPPAAPVAVPVAAPVATPADSSGPGSGHEDDALRDE